MKRLSPSSAGKNVKFCEDSALPMVSANVVGYFCDGRMLNSTLLNAARISLATADMKCRILLIGAEARNRGRLQQLLAEDMSVKATQDAGEGIALACNGVYDIVLLDAVLPALDGLEALRLIRARCVLPVIMLTGSGAGDRITALYMGADDCVNSSCPFPELVARINAVLRRCSRNANLLQPIEIGSVRIDPGSRNAWFDGDPLVLTSAEYVILETLMREAGRVVTRERLTWTLRQKELSGVDRSLDVHMAHLRDKIGRPSPIRTVRGEGYFFCYEPLE